MQIQGLFPTPLIVGDLGAEDVCLALRDIILRRESQGAGVQHSNVGGWQSGADFLTWGGDEGEALVAAIREVADRFTGQFGDAGLTAAPPPWRVSAWANVNRAGHANDLHFHPASFWSACFYVDDGGIGGDSALGGAIEFSDPRGPMPMMHAPLLKMTISHCASAGLAEPLYPKTGMLLMFPSWLAHRVTPYHGTGVRISIAMNFAL